MNMEWILTLLSLSTGTIGGIAGSVLADARRWAGIRSGNLAHVFTSSLVSTSLLFAISANAAGISDDRVGERLLPTLIISFGVAIVRILVRFAGISHYRQPIAAMKRAQKIASQTERLINGNGVSSIRVDWLAPYLDNVATGNVLSHAQMQTGDVPARTCEGERSKGLPSYGGKSWMTTVSRVGRRLWRRRLRRNLIGDRLRALGDERARRGKVG